VDEDFCKDTQRTPPLRIPVLTATGTEINPSGKCIYINQIYWNNLATDFYLEK
jgi:hypothetical protein